MSSPTVPEGGGPVRARVPTIIVVDDEEAILSSLRSLFRRQGYTLHAFPRAAAALEFVRKMPVDLIVSDLRMPVMTGIEFLNQAAAVNPQAVRIILSGYEDKGVVMNALAKGLAQHYVLKPWDDYALKTLVAQSLKRLNDLRHQRLEGTLGSLDALPSPPQLHERLRGMLAKADSSVDAIAKEIETSPPVVAKVLRVANSVYYGSRKSVTTIREGVVFIGTEYIASLVAAIEAFHGFSKKVSPDLDAQIEGLWGQACTRATIARKIGEKWPGFKNSHTAYVASLLQDIGFAVRLCSEPEKYKQYLTICAEGKMPPYQADQSIFGIAHDEVGAALLEYWNLPPEIVSAVLKHHRLTDGDILVQILQVAETLDGADPSAPHDPEIVSLASTWRDKVRGELEAIHPKES